VRDTVIPPPGETGLTGCTGQPGDAATSTAPAKPSTLERLRRDNTMITTNYSCRIIGHVPAANRPGQSHAAGNGSRRTSRRSALMSGSTSATNGDLNLAVERLGSGSSSSANSGTFTIPRSLVV